MRRIVTVVAATLVAGAVGIAAFSSGSGAQTSGDIFDQAAAEGHALQQHVADLQAQLDAANATIAQDQATIADLQAQVAALTPPSATTPPPPPPTTTAACAGVAVRSDIQGAIDANPAGTTFCLSGSFVLTAEVHPKSGDTFIGPADITGAIDTGFELKLVNAVNVTLDNLTIHDFLLRGLDCWTGTIVRNSEFYGNLRNGLGCGLDDTGGVLIEGNYIHDNGSPAETGRGAGGMKFARSGGVVIRDNRIEHNIGVGAWCDVDCGDFTVTGNYVWGQTRKGVHYEISHGSLLVANNTVTENNCAPSVWGAGVGYCDLPGGGWGPQGGGGAGIGLNSSCPQGASCVVRDNVLGGNALYGIFIRDDSRQYNVPFSITISNNTLNGDKVGGCNLAGVTCTGNLP